MQFVFEHFQIDLDKRSPVLHHLHIPFAKRSKGSCCNTHRRGNGEKEMDLLVHFLSFFTIFGSTLWGSRWTKGFKAAAWRYYINAGEMHALYVQGPMHSPHRVAPSFLLCRLSLRSHFVYILHHTHCFPVSLQMPSNNWDTLFSFENLDVLNFVFHKHVVGKVVSLWNAVSLWTNRL